MRRDVEPILVDLCELKIFKDHFFVYSRSAPTKPIIVHNDEITGVWVKDGTLVVIRDGIEADLHLWQSTSDKLALTLLTTRVLHLIG